MYAWKRCSFIWKLYLNKTDFFFLLQKHIHGGFHWKKELSLQRLSDAGYEFELTMECSGITGEVRDACLLGFW